MWDNEQKAIWQDIKDTWNEQPQSEKINIQVSKLIEEFKGKVSQFEKDSINSDIATLKVNWAKTKRNKVSQFEKDSIKKDINIISEFIKKVIDRFKR
ncbi:hypothetical protein U3A58_04810 [Algoriphagus sp. C2-6-M1]|uniref:hypothetical protein n=1 Tax=Algoriphagus persicinus TaxID=3108754 RepID=UPI002B3F01EE|nr:hypothetical protein [Algoriphagus sp. C2-6-M1]MEB2779705.1 hypothetical protein [Algoriphagus sp. C2-6-M1]